MPLILLVVPCLAGLFSFILLVTTEMIPAWKRQYHWYRFWSGQKKVSISYQWYKIDTIKLPLLIPCFDTKCHFLPATRKWYSKFGMMRTTLRIHHGNSRTSTKHQVVTTAVKEKVPVPGVVMVPGYQVLYQITVTKAFRFWIENWTLNLVPGTKYG